MPTTTLRTAPLGDLVAAAFDQASRFSADPKRISHRAVQTVREVLRQAREMLEHRQAQDTEPVAASKTWLAPAAIAAAAHLGINERKP